MKDISRRDFLAGIATLGLAGCSGKPDKTDSSTLKPKKGTLKNESSPQSSDIVVTMDPIYNYQVGQSGCGYITKIKNTSDQVAVDWGVDGIAKKADGTLCGTVSSTISSCCALLPGQEIWYFGAIDGIDELPVSLELTFRVNCFKKVTEKDTYEFTVLNERLEQIATNMCRFDVEIQNDSPYDYGMGTTLMGVLKDDMGNVVNGFAGGSDVLEAGCHTIISANSGLDLTGSPYASYEYSILKNVLEPC